MLLSTALLASNGRFENSSKPFAPRRNTPLCLSITQKKNTQKKRKNQRYFRSHCVFLPLFVPPRFWLPFSFSVLLGLCFLPKCSFDHLFSLVAALPPLRSLPPSIHPFLHSHSFLTLTSPFPFLVVVVLCLHGRSHNLGVLLLPPCGCACMDPWRGDAPVTMSEDQARVTHTTRNNKRKRDARTDKNRNWM